MNKVLKVLVKAGLKTFVPVVGEFAVDVTEAGVEQLVDAREKAKLDDMATRLVDRLRTAVSAWTQSEGVDAGTVEGALEAAQAIASRPATLLAAWTEAGFDPRRAAEACVDASPTIGTGLSATERGVCITVLAALFEGLAVESKALESTEARFRRQVLAALSANTELLERFGPGAVRAGAVAALSVPTQRWSKDLSPPGALLRADLDDPVPFHGRGAEMVDLETWCTSDVPLSVRVYVGRGGIGKTRLMRELCRRVAAKGVRAGMLDATLPSSSPELWDAIVAWDQPMLAIIDYAETRRGHVVALVAALIRRLDEDRPPARRVVLIARAADEWWSQLRGEAGGVGDVFAGPQGSVHKLGSVSAGAADRVASFDAAARHFASKLGQRNPESRTESSLDGEEYATTLLLHTAALAAVDGVSVKGDQGILDYILDRERRFWRTRASAAGLSDAITRGFGRAMAAVTLQGGVESSAAALELLGRLEFFAAETPAIREQVAVLLHETYPGQKWIEPLLPDLLGEHLCQQELADPAAHEQVLDIVLGRRSVG